MVGVPSVVGVVPSMVGVVPSMVGVVPSMVGGEKHKADLLALGQTQRADTPRGTRLALSCRG